MRWFWIDRFEEFVSGSHCTAIKNVSLAEEHLHDHFPGFPVMPHSLMIEGMAQTGGLLLGESSQFEHIVILAKIPKVEFFGWVAPGDTLRYSAKLLDKREDGGITEVKASVGDRLICQAEIVFAHLQAEQSGMKIDQKNFVFNSGLMGVFDVANSGGTSVMEAPVGAPRPGN